MVEPLRHRQTKEAATDMFDLQPLRHISTLPWRLGLSDRGIAPQVINCEQNWHRLSLYLDEGGGIGRPILGRLPKTVSEFAGDLGR
jgi:hypothetical protein